MGGGDGESGYMEGGWRLVKTSFGCLTPLFEQTKGRVRWLSGEGVGLVIRRLPD